MPSKLKFAVLLAVLALLSAPGVFAATNVFYVRAQAVFLRAQIQFQNETNNAVAWRFGRACFEYGLLATNDTQRAEIARLGIAACRMAIQSDSNSAPAHFYLATNLGELAQATAPSLMAYRLVHDVEAEFIKAAELDAHFGHAGAARSLGELYFKAPGWPLSVGSNRKAREWFEAAVRLEPGYPGNHLDLAEARLKWREREKLESSLKTIEALWPAARTNFTGEDWEAAWLDWNARRTALKAEYHRLYEVD